MACSSTATTTPREKITPFTDLASTNTVPIRTWSDTASWVYTPSSSVVNEMRMGYDRVTFNFVNLDVNIPANGTGYPINTGVTNPLAGGMPNLVIGGFGNSGTPVLGTANNRPQYFTPNPYYDFQDSVSVLKGKHSFKFGGEFTHIEADGAIFVGGRGQFHFNGGTVRLSPVPRHSKTSSPEIRPMVSSSTAIRPAG